MQRMFPQLEPPNNHKAFMDKVGWQLILLVATIIAALIAAIILGTTHVIGFDWIVTILVVIMLGTMGFCVWYNFRTREKFQEQYNKDIAAIKNDVLTFKNDVRHMSEDETHQWNEWAISFSAQTDKEHRERTEELKRQCMEAIHDAELRLDVSVKNAQSIFSGAVESNRIAVELYGQQLIHALNQMGALEERLRKESTPENEE